MIIKFNLILNFVTDSSETEKGKHAYAVQIKISWSCPNKVMCHMCKGSHHTVITLPIIIILSDLEIYIGIGYPLPLVEPQGPIIILILLLCA